MACLRNNECSCFSWGEGFQTIVNKGNPVNIKAANKEAEMKVGGSTHTLCMNYVIAMFPSVNCMNTRNQLLYFARFCARSTPNNSVQKPTTKNIAGFRNHFPLLTMFKPIPKVLNPQNFCFLPLPQTKRNASPSQALYFEFKSYTLTEESFDFLALLTI